MGKVVKGITGALGFGGGDAKAPALPGSMAGPSHPANIGHFTIKDIDDFRQKARSGEEAARARSDEAVQQRRQFIDDIRAKASGEAPSLAEAQLRSATDRNLAQQLAAAQAQRGGNVAAQQRQLAQQGAQAGREVAQDAAQARLQEQMGYEQMLAQQLGQEQEMADQLMKYYLDRGFSIEEARTAALMDFERTRLGQDRVAAQIASGNFQAQQQAGAQMGAAGLGLLGTGLGLASKAGLGGKIASGIGAIGSIFTSDETKKTKIKKVDKKDISKMLKVVSKSLEKSEDTGDNKAKNESEKKDIKKDFLDKLTAYTYEYKKDMKDKPEAGKGRFMSIMAQDLEKTPLGKNMVIENEDGVKMIDSGKGFGAILAAQAHLNKRLEELEKKKSKTKKSKKD